MANGKEAQNADPIEPVRRADYIPPEYLVDDVHLVFKIIDDTRVKVTNTMLMRSAQETVEGDQPDNKPIVLNVGKKVEKIISVEIDGIVLNPDEYTRTDSTLELPGRCGSFTVRISNVLNPEANKSGSGLYRSGDILLTQNESYGFRDITPFPDRPDVLSTWSTEITGDKEKYPVLLATGDGRNYRENDDGTHTSEFISDVKMPAYLYALVVGKLGVKRDQLPGENGEDPISLEIYADPDKLDRTAIAMEALKMAIKWDREKFGRKYPLKQYRIVVADNFNMGAMENLGLNIFTANRVLVDPTFTTDEDILMALSTVAHEQFHTWRGDMVTVRSWHEVALKEGFVDMTEKMFMAGLLGKSAAKILEIRRLRTLQFPEDAGATAHAIWPEDYTGDPAEAGMYSSTIYLKGGQVIGMARTLLGDEKFRAGLDKYFDDYKGKAATIGDLINCLQDVSGMDLRQFKNWFGQIGTPVCDVISGYNPGQQTLWLKIKQTCPREPKQALHFPFVMGLIGPDGQAVPLELLDGVERHDLGRGILNITREEETFVFKNVPPGTVPSLLRSFSAPVTLNYDYSNDDLLRLMKHDEDGFNRHEASQRIVKRELNRLATSYQNAEPLVVDEEVLGAFKIVLDRVIQSDPILAAEMLVLPTEAEIVQSMEVYDFEAANKAKEALRSAIATKFRDRLLQVYTEYQAKVAAEESREGAPVINIEVIKLRSIKNVCLSYLSKTGGQEEIDLIKNQAATATNMSDAVAALELLANIPHERDASLNQFREKWRHEDLVMNKWLRVQGSINDPRVMERARKILESEDFDINKQSNVLELVGFGVMGNHLHFHDKSGEGYRFAADVALTLKSNPQISSRIIKRAFSSLPKMDELRQRLMRRELERLLASDELPDGPKLMAKKILEAK